MEQVTIKEIARLCGVGVSTVSRAINNHPDINEETKNRILETIREYRYIPNNSARNLKRSESQTIAVLVKGIGNPFFGLMIQVLEREIIRKHYSFFLQQVEDNEDEIETAIQLEKEKRLKGIIFLGGMYHHTEERLKHLTVPCVISTVDMELPETMKDCAVVAINDEEESCRLVDYLCRCGHRRIAVLTSARDDVSIGKRRYEGYERALREHGIMPDENLIVRMRREFQAYTIQNGYEMTRQLLGRNTDFDCLYAISDTLAIGACRALFDAGKRIPEDVSVAGFDGLDFAEYYHPSITTMCQPREEMAAETVRLLFELIKKKSVQCRVIFQASLREGESVSRGAAAGSVTGEPVPEGSVPQNQ